MKKLIVLILLIVEFSFVFANGKKFNKASGVLYEFEDGYAVVSNLQNKFGIVNDRFEYSVDPQYESMQNLGEGYFFVCDRDYSKYVIDSFGKRVTDKKIRRAYHCSGGKIPVEGYEDEEAGITRIFDVKKRKFSEILPNLWIYAGFYDGIACFSTKNSENLLKVVLINSDLKTVNNMEFDLFEHRDPVTGNWFMKIGEQEYVYDKSGRLIQ